jgi:hypothetical protein
MKKVEWSHKDTKGTCIFARVVKICVIVVKRKVAEHGKWMRGEKVQARRQGHSDRHWN